MPGWIGSIPKRMPPIPASFAAMRCRRACSSSSSSPSGADCPGPAVLPSVSSAGWARIEGCTRLAGVGGAPNLMPPSFAMRSAIVLRRFRSSFPSDSLAAGGTGGGVAGDADERGSVPLIGGGEREIVVVLGDLDGAWNRGSIGSRSESVSTRGRYRREVAHRRRCRRIPLSPAGEVQVPVSSMGAMWVLGPQQLIPRHTDPSHVSLRGLAASPCSGETPYFCVHQEQEVRRKAYV